MPSFQDSAVIFVIALLLFGPKKLPELARQLGKLMGEFRRASNDFRIQMEDELRISEQADRQKEIAAMEAAAPVLPVQVYPAEEHPHLPPPASEEADAAVEAEPATPLPIAVSGSLQMMPPSTGLPQAREVHTPHGTNGSNGSSTEVAALGPLLDSIPEAPARYTGNTIHSPEPESELEPVQADHHG